jgi:hypothetical protein
MKEQQVNIISNALRLAHETGSERVFVFINSRIDSRWLIKTRLEGFEKIVAVLPLDVDIQEAVFRKAGMGALWCWFGSQSRFSRIKYAFMQAVMLGLIDTGSKVVCVLGPWDRNHLDTITIHDLSLSWSEEFPFDPRALTARAHFTTVMAVIDIALEIGALGREGKPVGTAFVIGDKKELLAKSHQAVFNPFRGYPKKERLITRPEVVESVKELAQLDGAFIITPEGAVEAAGRHLNAVSPITKQLRGLGSRHRAGAGITRKSETVAVVVSESTGRVTIFERGKIIATLEPVIGTRLA